jgi:ArsR family transcriptional regulator
MRDVVKIFKALSDPNRVRILKMLEVRPLCVCEITDILRLSTSTVSKHLSILRDVNLIVDQKDGKWMNYSLNATSNGSYSSQMLSLISNWLPDDETVQKDIEKVKTVDRYSICGI